MPHQPRAVSASGFYHVTMRGNAKAIIFECDEHRQKFLDILKHYRDELGFRIIAWCLMDNHVHIILDAYGVDLSDAVHHITTAYATFFNRNEDRVGHVFQCPFRSIPIESDAQLVNTVRYIHLNPVRAQICDVDEYEWSSYKEYALEPELANVEVVLGICGGKEAFFEEALNLAYVARIKGPGGERTDEELLRRLKTEMGLDDAVLSHVQTARKDDRARIVLLLKTFGASNEQVARLCGIGVRSVTRLASAAKKYLSARQDEADKLSIRRIVIVPYDAGWPDQFEKYQQVLRQALGDECKDVYHIGSTAVQGLAAKPTIDVMVTVRSLPAFDAKRQVLQDAGLEWLGEYGMPGRRYLVKRDGPHEVAHVHVFVCDDYQNISRHLAVREYLLHNQKAAEDYGKLKQELAQRYPYDPQAYWNGKASFVQLLEKEALASYEKPKGA
ncbi:MAG: GrpB family protein [Atopobiaceae bacterium]|nr:GrpB family protein [Atopobiaceae bacterium]